MKKIDEHNKMAEEGKYGYYLKMNSHGDKSSHEFANIMNGYRMDLKQVTLKSLRHFNSTVHSGLRLYGLRIYEVFLDLRSIFAWSQTKCIQ